MNKCLESKSTPHFDLKRKGNKQIFPIRAMMFLKSTAELRDIGGLGFFFPTYEELALFLQLGRSPAWRNSSKFTQSDVTKPAEFWRPTLAAHGEAVFPGQTVPVWTAAPRARTPATFSQMAPAEPLVTHLAFSDAKEKGRGTLLPITMFIL